MVTRWKRGGNISPLMSRRILDLHAVLARAIAVFAPEVVTDWLVGHEPFLNDARPIDVLAQRGAAPLMKPSTPSTRASMMTALPCLHVRCDGTTGGVGWTDVRIAVGFRAHWKPRSLSRALSEQHRCRRCKRGFRAPGHLDAGAVRGSRPAVLSGRVLLGRSSCDLRSRQRRPASSLRVRALRRRRT